MRYSFPILGVDSLKFCNNHGRYYICCHKTNKADNVVGINFLFQLFFYGVGKEWEEATLNIKQMRMIKQCLVCRAWVI